MVRGPIANEVIRSCVADPASCVTLFAMFEKASDVVRNDRLFSKQLCKREQVNVDQNGALRPVVNQVIFVDCDFSRNNLCHYESVNRSAGGLARGLARFEWG